MLDRRAGFYDTWVARDICGILLRPFWPYVKDANSRDRVALEQPFEVASCWNGVVAFPAQPYIRSRHKPSAPEKSVKLRTTSLIRRGSRVMDKGKPTPG